MVRFLDAHMCFTSLSAFFSFIVFNCKIKNLRSRKSKASIICACALLLRQDTRDTISSGTAVQVYDLRIFKSAFRPSLSLYLRFSRYLHAVYVCANLFFQEGHINYMFSSSCGRIMLITRQNLLP